MTYFLLLVSITMLATEVIPHHHHSDGQICMKDDAAPTHDEGCEHAGCHHAADGHCCCETGCSADYRLQQAPENGQELPAEACILLLYFNVPSLNDLLQSGESTNKRIPDNTEPLQDPDTNHAAGLRAPPLH